MTLDKPESTLRSARRRPPVLALLSFGCLLAALVLFLFGQWSSGFGFLVFHWLVGALVLITKPRRSSPAPDHDGPPQAKAT